MTVLNWSNASKFVSFSFVCGYCGRLVGSDWGYVTATGNARLNGRLDEPFDGVYICPNCYLPTYLHMNPGQEFFTQVPGPIYGTPIDFIPSDINQLFNEARKSISIQAYTGAVLLCRKILMHIAVEKGAAPGLSFVAYIEHLAKEGYIPPNGRAWVDHIRLRGNEANHEIVIMKQTDAEELVTFVSMLLRFIYEFPARLVPAPTTP